jgi:hypothetical protein
MTYVHVVRQLGPHATHARNMRLSTEYTLRADFKSYTRDFGREDRQLIHHTIDGLLEFQHLASHVNVYLLRELAFRHGLGHLRDLTHLVRQVLRHVLRKISVMNQIMRRKADDRTLTLSVSVAQVP